VGENGIGEGGTGAALIPYMGEALEQAQAWTRLPEDERKRQAMDAAQRHDVAALWRLTENWLLTHGEQGAHVSPHTRAAYARGGRLLLETWRHENLLRPSRMAGADWRPHLEGRGLKTSSVRVYLAAARALYAALRSAGATTADPFKDTRVARDRVPRWEKRTPYSNEEVATLLTVATGPEERLLVLLGAHSGLRNSEMLALTWPDVHLAGGHLVVQAGKGGKKRTVPLSTTLRAALAACAQTTGYVLPIQERRAGVRHRMTLVRRMRALCQRATVPYRSVHALRHTAGTRLYAQTGKIEDAAAFLGHSQLETSRVYIHHADEGVKTAVTTW